MAVATQTGYPQLAELTSAMEGVPSTNGWDVACSYNASQLNTFLAAQYDAGKLAHEVQLSVERQDPLSGASYTIGYDIRFDTPKLSFIAGRSGFAQLVMPIDDGSSYSVTPQGATHPTKSTSIPGGTYSVTAIVPLGAVNGTTGEVSEQGSIITFSDDVAHQNSVILHFKTAGGTVYGITPTPGPADVDALVTYFLPVLQQYFQTQVDEVDYVLATVTNDQPPAGETVLTPASFAFASMGDGDLGVLSLYIQTKESGNPPGNAFPSFQPGDTAMFPIDDAHTASIILSNSLIEKGFLTPQFTASGFGATFDTPSDGIQAKLTSPGSVVAAGKSDNWIFGNDRYDGLNITLSDVPLQVDFRQGNLSLHWHATTSSDWTQVESVPQGASAQYGTVDVAIDLNKGPIPLTLSDTDLTIASIDVSSSDFTVSTSAHGCKWYEVLVGCEEQVPDYYHNMTLQIPPISIALHGLDFFATTNVLAPGSRIIEIDGKAGVQTPHDFLIVGNVVRS